MRDTKRFEYFVGKNHTHIQLSETMSLNLYLGNEGIKAHMLEEKSSQFQQIPIGKAGLSGGPVEVVEKPFFDYEIEDDSTIIYTPEGLAVTLYDRESNNHVAHIHDPVSNEFYSVPIGEGDPDTEPDHNPHERYTLNVSYIGKNLAQVSEIIRESRGAYRYSIFNEEEEV